MAIAAGVLERSLTPQQIVDGLPGGDYRRFYQPTYDDPEALKGAIGEVQKVEPVTTPENVRALRDRLRAIATGEDDAVMVMDGRCAEPVAGGQNPGEGVEMLVKEALVAEEVVAASGLARVLHVHRCGGQCCKPRSNEFETLANGEQIVSFMGDMINRQGKDLEERKPDPQRLVDAAKQARIVTSTVDERLGEHMFAGHEALSLAYEQANLHQDGATGNKVLLSGDLPWIGVRTNQTDAYNPHIEMLAEVENAVGVKIGPDSTEEHIVELSQRLNPNGEDGKLVYMIRVGDDREAMKRILSGISKVQGKPVIMYDIHGSTVKKEDGSKVRSVDVTVEHIRQLAEECAEAGLKLHGLHIETMGDNSRSECVDTLDQVPTHRGDVDPQFNPRQTKAILDGVAPYLQPAKS